MRKSFIALIGMFLLFALLPISAAAAENYTGLIHNGSTMIPVRGVFQSMGAQVDWDQSTKKITIKKSEFQTELQVNSKQATVNGNMQTLDVAPFIQNGVTFLPLRFIAESIGAEVKWNQSTRIAEINYEGKVIQVKVTQSTQVSNAKITSFSKKVNGIQVTGVTIPANAGYKPKMALANGQLGTTQSLAQMAQSNQAIVAINGTYFGAYGGHPDPWNQIIQDGRVIHIGNTGSTFGFTEDGRVKLEKLKISVKGSTNGSFTYPNNWYAYNFNHWPTKNGNFAYIFTPAWGKTLGFTYGKNIVIANGVVTKISSGMDVNIPANGYVLSLHGSEIKVLENRFKVGTKVDYQVSFTNRQGKEVDWSDVITAVGAGPSLVQDGKIIVDAASEGFTEAKILSQSNSRSAIGAKANGDILLVHATTNIQTLAQIMKSLGAVQAMNLDGGASSGIYFNGKYLVKPGRNLSNALVFTK
ncbi:stalk domain-containing protein [Cytobacillus sp. FJAT-53684]|uniref:Stalk domain-containing protein n=1 Tax=Cytobacillus mangrovibacter TaxID=3299024 RepID=A0ABW6JYM2_9BACI